MSNLLTVHITQALRSIGLRPHEEPWTIKLTGGPDGDVAGRHTERTCTRRIHMHTKDICTQEGCTHTNSMHTWATCTQKLGTQSPYAYEQYVHTTDSMHAISQRALVLPSYAGRIACMHTLFRVHIRWKDSMHALPL